MTVENHGPLPSSNFMPGRIDPTDNSPVKIDSIVLHTMVGWIGAADGRFHNAAAQVSAHFGVRVDGSLWQWVDIWDTAYHAGLFFENLRSIGIEHEDGGDFNGPRSDALYARSAQLVAQFCRQYGIPCVRGTGGPGIYDHRDIIKVMGDGTATACPDALDTDRIIREAAALLVPPVQPVQPAQHPAFLGTSPVMGPSTFRYLPLVNALSSGNKNAPLEIASLYQTLAPLVGIRAEVALAQAIHETGFFTFAGRAQPDWHNPCGLGVGAALMAGRPNSADCRFPTWEEGVRAHLGHLLQYFDPTPDHRTGFCDKDPRHGTHRNLPNDLVSLVGTWAIPGVGYADAIAKLIS